MNNRTVKPEKRNGQNVPAAGNPVSSQRQPINQNPYQGPYSGNVPQQNPSQGYPPNPGWNGSRQPPASNQPYYYPQQPNQPYYPQQPQSQRQPVQPQPQYPVSPVPGQPVFQNWQDQVSASQSPDKAPEKKRSHPERDWNEIFGRSITMILVCFVVIYFGWLFQPKIRNAMTFWPTATGTPVTPSPTVPSTPTVTPLASNTPTLVPTATPGPISDYLVADGNTIDPAVPNAPKGVVQLSVKNSADVSPSLDNAVWASSKSITEELGKSMYTGDWYATLSNGGVRWFMDRALPEGLYEVYTMDTLYSSGGTLSYSVRLGDQVLISLTGKQDVFYMTSQYEPTQNNDVWRSLGIFYLPPSKEVLTISTSWENRDQYTYVALDRVLIVPRPNTDQTLLSMVPDAGTKYLMDDTQADIVAGESVIEQKDQTAWDDSYQLIMNPEDKTTITYSSKEPWPIGTYQVYLFMPANKGGIKAECRLYADKTLLKTDDGMDGIILTSVESKEGSWVKLGSYTTDRYYERPVKFKLSMSIEKGSTGEFPIDAVMFVQNDFPNQE